MMGGRQAGPWPGHGPFSHLPPWERPGWVYGRGACWRFINPWPQSGDGYPPAGQAMSGYSYPPAGYPGYPQSSGELTEEEEERMLKEELSELEERVAELTKRLGEPGR